MKSSFDVINLVSDSLNILNRYLSLLLCVSKFINCAIQFSGRFFLIRSQFSVFSFNVFVVSLNFLNESIFDFVEFNVSQIFGVSILNINKLSFSLSELSDDFIGFVILLLSSIKFFKLLLCHCLKFMIPVFKSKSEFILKFWSFSMSLIQSIQCLFIFNISWLSL